MSEATLQKSLLGVALATTLLLLIPAIAMQFTSEVSWGPGDFLVAGVLLFGAGSVTVLGLRHVRGVGRRAALVFSIAFALALVWAELAVGLFT
jgi:hypothetical protein